MKKIISIILCLACSFCFFSCSSESIPENAIKSTDEIKDIVEIEMKVENFGTITLELYHNIAPITVENFVSLTLDKFYDGLTFHRIVDGFMIQGGDPDGNGTGGSDKQIKGEFSANGFYNPLSHTEGVISMARGSYSMDSASSQFFICLSGNYTTSLDGQYAAFGRVTDGMDVVKKIGDVDVVYNDYGTEKSVPKETVKIEYVRVTGTYEDTENKAGVTALREPENPDAAPIQVEMSVLNHGIITLELYPGIAPETVENFVNLVNEKFYDGLTFHRIVKGFMIQGGDPKGNGTGDSGKNIKGEFLANGFKNELSHDRGVISMARGSHSMDSASCQFFICDSSNYKSSLDGKYAAFGKVIDGMDVVDSIAAVEVDYDDYGREKSVPKETVTIEYIRVLSESEMIETTDESVTK